MHSYTLTIIPPFLRDYLALTQQCPNHPLAHLVRPVMSFLQDHTPMATGMYDFSNGSSASSSFKITNRAYRQSTHRAAVEAAG
ncbi:MAG: hypothetical protein WA885_13160 [Phormidesmis sp.]